ncbi:MAG: carboxymuconolactone decarboxylase family protein [Pseudomonadota bacterium]|nr:carboxymuconolactone decarboxylase family protein [Pseudomonadota bacterium]
MSRIPLVRVEDMTPEQREQYDKFPSNLSRGLLLTEQRLARALPSLANALRASGLDAKLREGVILRVAALSGSAYERMQHLGQAEKAGWTATEIAAIEAGDLSGVPSEFAAVLKFVDECVATPRVSDAVFAEASRALSNRALATVILLVGHYMMVARFLGTLEIELDPEPDTWESEH